MDSITSALAKRDVAVESAKRGVAILVAKRASDESSDDGEIADVSAAPGLDLANVELPVSDILDSLSGTLAKRGVSVALAKRTSEDSSDEGEIADVSAVPGLDLAEVNLPVSDLLDSVVGLLQKRGVALVVAKEKRGVRLVVA